MNAKITFSLILLTSFASLLHGMKQDQQYLHSPNPRGTFGIVTDISPSTLTMVVCSQLGVVLADREYPDAIRRIFPLPPRSNAGPHACPIAALSSDNRWCAVVLPCYFNNPGILQIWDLKQPEEQEPRACWPIPNVLGMSERAFLAFSPSGSRSLCYDGLSFRIFDMNNLDANPRTIDVQGGDVYHALFTDESTIAYAQNHGYLGPHPPMKVNLFDIPSNSKKRDCLLPLKMPPIKQMVQARNKPHVLAFCANDGVWLWDTHRNPPQESVLLDEAYATDGAQTECIGLHPDARFLIAYVWGRGEKKCMFLYKTDLETPSITPVWKYQFDPATLACITAFHWASSDLTQVNGFGSMTRWKLGPKMLEEKKDDEGRKLDG